MATPSRVYKQGPVTPVFDLMDCGPDSRFLVRPPGGGRPFIVHNCSQALARDIFSDALIRIDAAGHEIILHVHDEVVVECDDDVAEDTLQDIVRILTTPPEWIPDIPLGAEGHTMTVYRK